MILTNNKKIGEKNDLVFVDGHQMEVLMEARNYLHKGHMLISSPLAASGRMHFSPVRSLILSDEKYEALHSDGIGILENAILNLSKFLLKHGVDEKNRDDYEVIDKELLEEALKEIKRLNI